MASPVAWSTDTDPRPLLPLTWKHPRVLPTGLPELVDRFWAEDGTPALDVTIHVAANGRNNPYALAAAGPPRVAPYADVYFVATHHMVGLHGVADVGTSSWLFAQWKSLADALISELQMLAAHDDYHPPAYRKARLDRRLVDRQAFWDRLLADDDRLGQPWPQIGGVVGALWGRRLKTWRDYRKAYRAEPTPPHEYPRAVLNDARAHECGGQYALNHLVDQLQRKRFPSDLVWAGDDEDRRRLHRHVRNDRYRVRYHLLNACPGLDIWRTVLARTPAADGSRRVYHFFTHGERTRLLAAVVPALPSPRPLPPLLTENVRELETRLARRRMGLPEYDEHPPHQGAPWDADEQDLDEIARQEDW